MAAVITRSNTPKQLVPGLNNIFGLAYKDVLDQHTPLFQMESSQRAYEEELLQGQFGAAPVKPEGEGVHYDTAYELWTSRYTHETIALAFAITEEAVEDNLYEAMSKVRSRALGRAMAVTKQVKAANVFNNAFSPSYLGGDAKSLCATDHPLAGGGTLSNRVATDLSETALETAIITMAGWTDDRGIIMAVQPRSLHIPANLQFEAERILKSPLQPFTADNTLNALKSMGKLSGGVYINNRFTDTNAWFIQTDVDNGTKMFTRVKLSTKMEGDFDTGNTRYKARERYSFGWSDWRRWYGSAGST